MKQLDKITLLGIEISISEESDGTFTVYFSNAAGSFEELHHVGTLKKIKTAEDAREQGRKFVSDHQWQNTGERIGIFQLHIRHWWNGEWGYGVWAGGMNNKGGFKTKDEALIAGRIKAQEMYSELEESIK